jgi:hypothetical protein
MNINRKLKLFLTSIKKQASNPEELLYLSIICLAISDYYGSLKWNLYSPYSDDRETADRYLSGKLIREDAQMANLSLSFVFSSLARIGIPYVPGYAYNLNSYYDEPKACLCKEDNQ